jgi:TPR repeat protein
MTGLMYHQGLGVPKDLVQAVQCYALAAAKGEVKAQHILGLSV